MRLCSCNLIVGFAVLSGIFPNQLHLQINTWAVWARDLEWHAGEKKKPGQDIDILWPFRAFRAFQRPFWWPFWGPFRPIEVFSESALQVPFWVLMPPAALTLSRHHSRPREMLRPTGVHKVTQCTAQVYQVQSQSLKDALERAHLHTFAMFVSWHFFSTLKGLEPAFCINQSLPGNNVLEQWNLHNSDSTVFLNVKRRGWFVYRVYSTSWPSPTAPTARSAHFVTVKTPAGLTEALRNGTSLLQYQVKWHQSWEQQGSSWQKEAHGRP